jgi:hypothetical protein
MARNTLSARLSTRVAANKEDFRLPTLREVAYILLAAFSLGIAALLLSWSLKLSDQRQLENCRNLGRAGTLCGGATSDDQPVAPADGDCASLGRAGRVCFEHPHE